MKKLNLLIILIFLFSFLIILLFSFKYKNIGKKEVNGSGSLILVSKTGSLNGTGFIEDKKEKEFTQEDLKKECQKIVDGKESKYIENNKEELIHTYNKALGVIKKNEYSRIMNLKEGLCENFSDDGEKKICNAYKQKNIEKANLEQGTYDYVLLDSMIDGKNKCAKLKQKKDIEDCSSDIDSFLKLKNIDYELGNILALKTVEKGKVLVNLGEKQYLELINKEFLDKCNVFK